MLLPLVALLMSCTKIDETPGTDNITISWNIYSADDLNGTFLNDGSKTKAFVNNYSDLKTACMHNESSAAEKYFHNGIGSAANNGCTFFKTCLGCSQSGNATYNIGRIFNGRQHIG